MQPIKKFPTAGILDDTESVCPICLKVIAAQVIAEKQAVYMKKLCPDHGAVLTYLWPDVEHYNWMKAFRFPLVGPEQPVDSTKGCPHDCGLCANHLRHPTLVEIELTQQCNMRCPVCFMAAGEALAAVEPEPGLAAIKERYKAILDKTGPQTSIQLTGGEPTTRRDLPEIVRLGRRIGFTAIEVNTNGKVIGRNPAYLKQLAEAGISGIYLQFDGLTRSVYKQIRGEDVLNEKLQAIENCRQAGVQVVLAVTVISGVNQDQMGDILQFALKNRDVIAGIAYQPAFGSGRFDISTDRRLTMGDVVFMLAQQSRGLIKPYDFWPLACAHPLCDSATYLIEDQGEIKPLTRLITVQDYTDYFDPDSPQGSVFGDIAARMFPHVDPGFSIVIMNFMDALSMDLKRLRECSMTVAGPDGRIIPFCAYQLTDQDGKRKSK